MKTTYTLEENNQTGTISGLDCASAQSRLSLSLSLSRLAQALTAPIALKPSAAVSILDG